MEVRYVSPLELRDWWPWVKNGLQKVLEKTTEPWIPEDLYCDCYEKRSMLWVVLCDNHPEGFFVIQPNGVNMHIWIAYLSKPNLKNFRDGFEHIKGIAKNGGCETLTFSSNRKGWTKRAKELGFRERTWICEV